jgi:peptidoglycan hydrolase-like protein with peptidoglycan-binding domain
MIAAWQKSRGFPDTGYLTAPQFAALQQQGATAIARYEEEQKRLADARRRAEEKAKADAAAAEAARRQAEEQARAESEARRKAEQEAAARRAAEEKARAEAEAKRQAEQKAQAEAEARRQAEAAEVALRLTDHDRKQVRVALASLGFDPGADASGPFGPSARRMIAAWQQSREMPDTGYLNGPQLAALRQQGAGAIARYEEEQKKRDEARRKAEEEAKRKAAAAGELYAGWAGFQGCIVSAGGRIGNNSGDSAQIVQRKVCFNAAGAGRYDIKLDNGMTCDGTARKTNSPVGFSVDRQTCTAATTGRTPFTWIHPFEATCTGAKAGTLSCDTTSAIANGRKRGPFIFRRQ